jgi:serine/threonine-protein phosphatase 2A regulatory subunit B'
MKGFLNKVQRRVSGTVPPDMAGKTSDKPSTPSLGNGKGGDLPKSDVAMPRKERRRSSFARAQKLQVLKDLPLLSDTPMQKREALFKQKLQLCGVIFNFDDAESDTRGKELKRDTLLELAEYVNSPVGQKIFTESLMTDIVEMVRANLFRTLPPQTEDFDPEEDEPSMEAAWPHLQVVYEFFLRFVVSSEVNGKVAKRYVDQSFIRNWIELFDAEDPRERDYVKTILHRMYGKFMSYRSFIRKSISQVFYRYIYETGKHNGIGELLEILGSIINGFAIPLKAEHLQFLERALIPLHKPRALTVYHPQLSYCISQYVEKDPDTIVTIVTGLVRYWPWSCSSKQVLLLNELEEIMELCRGDQLTRVQDQLFQLLALCLNSEHFQVVERALYFWNSEHLCANILAQSKAHIFLPFIFGPLSKNAQGHWNQTVESLAQSVLKMYMELDINLYDRCSREHNDKERTKLDLRTAANAKWLTITESANAKGVRADE